MGRGIVVMGDRIAGKSVPNASAGWAADSAAVDLTAPGVFRRAVSLIGAPCQGACRLNGTQQRDEPAGNPWSPSGERKQRAACFRESVEKRASLLKKKDWPEIFSETIKGRECSRPFPLISYYLMSIRRVSCMRLSLLMLPPPPPPPPPEEVLLTHRPHMGPSTQDRPGSYLYPVPQLEAEISLYPGLQLQSNLQVPPTLI